MRMLPHVMPACGPWQCGATTLIEKVYTAKGVHINPRGKFIAIKVDQARVRDRKMLALLEKDYELLSITKVVTEQGVTYRIPKI